MFSIWIPKIAAFLAALAASFFASRGWDLSEKDLTAIFIGVLGVVNTVLTRFMNPGNVAAPALVEPMKREAAVIQETEKRARAQRRANEPRG